MMKKLAVALTLLLGISVVFLSVSNTGKNEQQISQIDKSKIRRPGSSGFHANC